jgi:hypothetical protein
MNVGHVRPLRAIAVVGVIGSLIVLIALLASGGRSATAAEPVSYSAYPALDATGPTGLDLVASTASPNAAPGPSWQIEDPSGGLQGGWPIASSIRRLDVSVPGVEGWIAKSVGGGLCVLASSVQSANPGVGASCAPDSRNLATGSSVELSELAGLPGTVIAVGAVPSTVSSVEVEFKDGSKRRVAVSDNAWALSTQSPPTSYHFNGTGLTTKVGG